MTPDPHIDRSVLVTGAAGYLGRQLVDGLAGVGFTTIIALDVRDQPVEDRVAGVVYRTADIRDPTLVDLLREHAVDSVAHLAAIVNPAKGSSRELEHSIDVLGTENVLRACIDAGVGQLVVTSSGAAYGYHADNPVPLSESDALRGNREFAYSDHKRQVEELLARGRVEHPELRQLVFRPGAILGDTTHNQITDLFEQKVVLGVAGSDAPFTFVWDRDVVACIVKGVVERGIGDLQPGRRRHDLDARDRPPARQALRTAPRVADPGGAGRAASTRSEPVRARAGRLPPLPAGVVEHATEGRVRVFAATVEHRGVRAVLHRPRLWLSASTSPAVRS